MTPHYNTTHQAVPAPLPAGDTLKTENQFALSEKGEKENSRALPLTKKVNDPAQWDEAWFANYE